MAPSLGNGVLAIIGGGLISEFFPIIHTCMVMQLGYCLIHAASIVELVSISFDLAWPVVSLLWTLIGASHQIQLDG